MIPTQRSVIARLQYRSLDGGWSDVSLCRATRIRVFPRNAVIERKIFRAERKMSSPSTALIWNSAEPNISLNVFWFSSSVKFASSIFLWDEMRCKWGLYLYIALLNWVECDIDDESHIIFTMLTGSISKDVFERRASTESGLSANLLYNERTLSSTILVEFRDWMRKCLTSVWRTSPKNVSA